jgi:adenosylcobinamide-GDP ribazoletransferase
VVSAFIISRTAMTELAVCLPYARTEGGTGSPFVDSAQPAHRYFAWGGGIFLLFAFYGPFGSILFIAGGIFTWLCGLWFYRCIGGITGDLLGAAAEMVETGLLYFCIFCLQKPAFMISWKVFLDKTMGFF